MSCFGNSIEGSELCDVVDCLYHSLWSSVGDSLLDVHDPSTNEVLCKLSRGGAAEVDRAAKTQLASHLSGGKGLTMSQIREILATSRKYAVPYCEYLDKIAFTKRDGDVRVLA